MNFGEAEFVPMKRELKGFQIMSREQDVGEAEFVPMKRELKVSDLSHFEHEQLPEAEFVPMKRELKEAHDQRPVTPDGGKQSSSL